MDFVTINVKITRTNLKEGEEQGFIHSLAFPYLKKENLHIMLVDAEKELNIFAY